VITKMKLPKLTTDEAAETFIADADLIFLA